MFDGFDHRRETVGDVEIAYSIGGSGPPVLMMHGFPQSRFLWAHVAPRLADRFTLVCPDLRGYGDSSKPRDLPDSSNYSFRAMSADQIGLMRALGFPRFHVIGHDRGGRVGHRMALDHGEAVASLAVLDIVPTYAAFMDTNRRVAGAYWHWYFLSQAAPFPETMIAADPDTFYETCLVGWGATRLENFDAAMLSNYRRCWRDPAMIHGSCSDYRAAAGIDLEHDGADLAEKVACPVLAFWGSKGTIERLFDVGGEWRKRCADVRTTTLPGGHFFIDLLPRETADELGRFLGACQL